MKIKKAVYFLTFVLCFLNIQAKSMENEEENTNEITETLEAEVSTAEPETEPVSVAISTEQDTQVQTTTEPNEKTEPATTTEPTTREPEQCNPDSYCQAELLPAKLILNSTFIMCDQRVQPKYRCCLPTGPHLACYNIMVDGQYLNYDVAVAQLSTDIYGLCGLIIQSQKKVQGQYTAASIEEGEGRLVYNYKKWTLLEGSNTESPQHIKDLACGIGKKEE